MHFCKTSENTEIKQAAKSYGKTRTQKQCLFFAYPNLLFLQFAEKNYGYKTNSRFEFKEKNDDFWIENRVEFVRKITFFLFCKDQQNIFWAGMSLDFSNFQAETSLKCP